MNAGSYSERRVSSPLACCTWEQQTSAVWEQRVVPDACVDLIWSGERLNIAGPDTRARLVALSPGTRIVGVRLRPGAAGTVLGLPAGEVLQDAAPDAADVLGPDQAEALLGTLLGTGGSGGDPHAILLAAIERRGTAAHPDPLVRAAVAALNRPHARVATVAAELGVSARQLQRRVPSRPASARCAGLGLAAAATLRRHGDNSQTSERIARPRMRRRHFFNAIISPHSSHPAKGGDATLALTPDPVRMKTRSCGPM